jgi:hypothetical protein
VYTEPFRAGPEASPDRATISADRATYFDVTRDITTFYEADGPPVYEIFLAKIAGTLTNAVTQLAADVRRTRLPRRSRRRKRVHDRLQHRHQLPDGGVAVVVTGRLVFDAAGNLIEHDGPDTVSELAQLCALA